MAPAYPSAAAAMSSRRAARSAGAHFVFSPAEQLATRRSFEGELRKVPHGLGAGGRTGCDGAQVALLGLALRLRRQAYGAGDARQLRGFGVEGL